MQGSDAKTRLVIWGGAVLISAVSFGLILWISAWLPHVLLSWWMHLSPIARKLGMPLYFLFVAMVSAMIPGIGQSWRLRARRSNAARAPR